MKPVMNRQCILRAREREIFQQFLYSNLLKFTRIRENERRIERFECIYIRLFCFEVYIVNEYYIVK